MAITKMEGRTYQMLAKDARVAHIRPDGDDRVWVGLAEGWSVDPLSTTPQGGSFENWEAARNWVRKAKQVDTVPGEVAMSS